jgi:hypothetical protein
LTSIGSRREGATLATVLQNAATFTNALEATTNAAGERQERFAEIIDRLTGQLARLRVELVQLGLDIFDAGLEDVLSGILDALGLTIDAFQLLGSVLGFVIDIFSFLPDGFNQSLVILLSLAAASKALIAVLALAGSNVGFLSTAFIAVGNTAIDASNAFKAGGAGLRGLAAGAQVTAVALKGLAASFAPLAIAAAAVLAYNEFRNAVNEANEAAAENRERIADLAPGLAEQADQFSRAAERARNYASALSEVNEQEDRLSGPTTGPLGRSFDEGLNQIEDADLRSRTRVAFADFAPSDLDDFGQRLASRQSDVAAVARALEGLRENEDESLLAGVVDRRQGPGLFLAQLEDLVNQTEVPPEVRELGQAVLDGELNIEEAIELITVFYNTATAENLRIKNAGQEAKDALERAFLDGDEDVVRRFQDDLGNLAAITDSRLLSELALELLQLPPEAVRAQEADLARQTIGLAREQFQAGVISQRDFLEVAREEIGDLRRIVQSNIQAGNTGEAATATAKELRELEEEIAKAVVERAEADRDFLELIGSPLGGQELAQSLIDLANSPDVQADSAQFSALVGDIIRAEQQIALDLIEGAESAEEQLAIRDAFGLSEAASRLVTLSQIQLNEDVLEVIAAAKIAAEELPAFFNDLATGVEEGVALGDLLIQRVLAEIERLTLVLLNVDDGSRAGVQEELSRLGDLADRVGSAFVITGADVGLRLEEDLDARIIQERIEGFIEQAERQANILNSLGQSDAAAAEKIRGLVAALRDPEFSSSGLDREELLIQLNDEINEVLEQEGEKSQAFLDAINQVVDGTNLTVQEFASVGLIQGLSDQSQVAFVSLVNGYIAANTALSNSLISETLAAAEVYGFGVDQARSVFKAALERLQALLLDILSNTDLFGLRSGTPEAFGAEALGVFNSIQRLNELINDPRLSPAVDSLKNFTVNAAGGGGNTLGDLLEAERALARALVSNNPEELARLELAIADEELVAAENRVEELQALTQQVEARRNLEQVLNDVFNAETQLAIAVLESQGDVAGALALGVTAAEQNLAFLQNVGAGAAEIAAAELSVLNAQNAQQDGLVQAQLDELGFLFNIGDLSTQAYITALQEILNQLDPVADVDLWRRISLQIKGLKDSSNELQFNLPDSFDLPTLYEVRRLNQGSFGGADALQLGASTTDNRQYSIEINVQTGMDWDDARDILADALGADTNVFSLGTRRY